MKIVVPGAGQELMLITQEGVVIRVKVEDVSKLGRSTQGVKVMNVSAHRPDLRDRPRGRRQEEARQGRRGPGRPRGRRHDGPAPARPVSEEAREAEAEALAAEEFDDIEESALPEGAVEEPDDDAPEEDDEDDEDDQPAE